MHKMYEYICDELKALEKKVESGQTLSMSELEYLHKLTDTKKNLLKIDALEEDSEYSHAGDNYTDGSMMGSYRGGSYARGGRGRSGRRGGANQYGSYAMRRYPNEGYSRAEDDFMADLRMLMDSAPDEQKRAKIQKLMNEM